MSGGIGNRRIMRALGAIMGIEDVKQAPARMKTDELIPVVGLDPGMAGYEAWQTVSPPLDLEALASVNWPIVGNDSGAAIFEPYRQLQNGDKEYAILGLRVTITYDGPGAFVDRGKTNCCAYYRKTVMGGGGIQAPESYVSMGKVEGRGGPEYFIHAFPMYIKQHCTFVESEQPTIWTVPNLNIRPLWVPAGMSIGLWVAKEDGSAWPENTTVEVSAWGVRCPKGMRPPGI